MATVLIPLAEGCEEMEAVILIDVLRRADIKVVTAGLAGDQAITASTPHRVAYGAECGAERRRSQ